MTKQLKILCGAGGTGGHLFPAVAVIEQIEKLYDGDVEVHFAGRSDKIEGEKVPLLGYKFHPVKIRGVRKLTTLSNLMIPFEIRSSVAKMRKLIRSEKFDFVLCTGSYISFPPGRAAQKEGIPLFLMESNVNPGKSINMLSKGAAAIFTSFSDSQKYFPVSYHDKIFYLGNPVRQSLFSIPEKSDAKAKFDCDAEQQMIFIFGGSLGAASINNAVEKNLDLIAKSDYKLLWQTGKNYIPPNDLPRNIIQTKFIDDMASAYAAADLVISRSGATTVAELAVIAKPSILVPLETASNNEQSLNAQIFEKNGAAKVLKNKELSKDLFPLAEQLLKNNELLTDMSVNAEKLAKKNAAKNTAIKILNLINLK